MSVELKTPSAACPGGALWALTGAAGLAFVVNRVVGTGAWVGLLAVLNPALLMLLMAAFLAAVRARLARVAEIERADLPQSGAALGSRIFDDGDELQGAPFSGERALAWFDRLAGWIVAPLAAAIQAGGVMAAAMRLRAFSAAGLEHIPWGAVIALGAEAFVFFVAGRVLLAWSRSRFAPGLRLAGQFAGFSGAAAMATIAVLVMPNALQAGAFLILEWVVAVVLALGACESAIRALAVFYRQPGAERHPLWDENLAAGFFAEPATWWVRLCETLDYQFGFSVSKTWAFAMAARAALPFFLFVAMLLYFSSAFVVLGPEESAVLERFGRPVKNDAGLTPGFHIVWPWPIETARRFPVKRIQTLSVGVHLEPGEEHPRVILWDVPHYSLEEYVLVAGRSDSNLEEAGRAVPANFLVVNIPVEYMVTNLYQYLYVHADPAGVLSRIASRAVTFDAAGKDLFDFFGQGQLATATALTKAIQTEADHLQLGIRVMFVGLQSVHPPVPVASAFQQVVGAVEEREADILVAHGYSRRLVPLAQAGAGKRLFSAQAESHRRVVAAAAEADLFRARVKSDAVAPLMFRSRILLDSLADGLGRARKILVAVEPGREVVSLNLESRLSRDLFDFALGTNAPTGDTSP